LNKDDVRLTRQILDEMQAEFCIDPARIYASGHSNGAILSNRLACELSDRIAAICAVGGGIGDVNPTDSTVYFNCGPSRPVPVLQIHGLQDGCYPYNGGYGAGISNTDFVSIPHTVADWVARNGCGASAVQTYSFGNAVCISYRDNCQQNAEVMLCTDTLAGHNWLGSAVYPSAATCGGELTTDIISNDVMWEFFLAHPMP
ncbi:MAG TPA: hypothetical protein P5511_02095, partial [Candidatus Goldiibacteriota bacterium]|nr:hypothetical protein [Candidatus Goldiibacteriota bacterium]